MDKYAFMNCLEHAEHAIEFVEYENTHGETLSIAVYCVDCDENVIEIDNPQFYP